VTPLVQQLLQAETGGAEPRLCLRTGTRIDAGRWWRRSPVWICITDRELIMLAVARRRLFARVALRDIQASRYHPPTGELVIEPGESLPLQRFKLPLRDALQVLQFINIDSDPQPHQPLPTS
jgi:hypothetical protein